jgi:hypothetical protein
VQALGSQQVVDRVVSREVELGISYEPIINREVETELLVRSDVGCVMREDHPLAALAEIDLHALEPFPIITYLPRTTLRPPVDRALSAAMVVPHISVQVSMSLTGLMLAYHGAGIALVEPFISTRVKGKVVNDLTPDAVIKSVHIAQGLGSSSAYTWMKLPVVHEMERVMDATTLPTLLLGGDPDGAPDETNAAWQAALRLPSVRGLVVGRTMLYPADDDVAAAVDTAVALVR